MVLTTPLGEENPLKSLSESLFDDQPEFASRKTLVFNFEGTLAATKILKQGEPAPDDFHFKFAVPLSKTNLVTIYIQMRENYKEMLKQLLVSGNFELVLVTDFSKAVGR
jgi:hypothetical protein